ALPPTQPRCAPLRCALPGRPRTPPRPPDPPAIGRNARRTWCSRRRPPPPGRGCSLGPRFPEVFVEPAVLVDLPERQLERHVDRDALGLAVRELHVEPPATVELDDGVRDRRVRTLRQVVVREREEPAAAGEAHLLEPVRVRAFDADPVLREPHRAAPPAAA